MRSTASWKRGIRNLPKIEVLEGRGGGDASNDIIHRRSANIEGRNARAAPLITNTSGVGCMFSFEQ